MTTADSMNLITQKCDTRMDMQVPSDLKKMVVKNAKKAKLKSWTTWVKIAIIEKDKRDNVQ